VEPFFVSGELPLSVKLPFQLGERIQPLVGEIAILEHEPEMHRRHSGFYGYELFVVREG